MEAAFFDLDKTVIARASMMAFSRPLYRQGLLSRSSLVKGLWTQILYLYLGAGEERLVRIRESVLAVTKGWDRATVHQVVAAALEDVVEPITFAEALELMDMHRQAGRRIYIVSASPAEIVEPLARFFGVDEAIASQAEVDEFGCYTGHMAFYAYGPAKAELMRDIAASQGIDLERSFAYSDSATDLPMLEAVGHPVAVNPDRPLRRIARERGWEIRQFVRPVRLRDRVPVIPSRLVTASVALTGGLATVAVLRTAGRRRTLATGGPTVGLSPRERLGLVVAAAAPPWTWGSSPAIGDRGLHSRRPAGASATRAGSATASWLRSLAAWGRAIRTGAVSWLHTVTG